MTEKLDFSLPQKKQKRSAIEQLTVGLLVALLTLVVMDLGVTVETSKRMLGGVSSKGLSEEQVKDLASKLAQRTLYQQAAAAWQDYLASAKLAGPEQARIQFQIGTLLEKGGLYADAIEHYYRSETVGTVRELQSDLNAHIKECFEKLGKFSALRYEVMDRTSLSSSQPAGGKVVAEIGAEKITEAQLDAKIEESIENQLEPMKAFMTPEQLNAQKKRALEQSRNPQTKQEFLQGWLAQEILYRQALQDKLSDKPEVQRVVHDLTRQALSQQLMNEQLASKIHVTDSDLQTYYAANKDKYVEPERAKISHILVKDEGQANDLLKRLKDGADFAAVAKESSQDEATKGGGGRIADDILKGSHVPGIGDANEINASIFAASAPSLLDKPFKTDKGWEIIKVEEKHAQRPKSFEEVQQQVAMQLLRQKREEVQRDYIKEMMDKHQVVIHTSAFAPAPPEASKETPSKP
jgi:parvulin-like peptidyl-prolyl isomerase